MKTGILRSKQMKPKEHLFENKDKKLFQSAIFKTEK